MLVPVLLGHTGPEKLSLPKPRLWPWASPLDRKLSPAPGLCARALRRRTPLAVAFLPRRLVRQLRRRDILATRRNDGGLHLAATTRISLLAGHLLNRDHGLDVVDIQRQKLELL